MDKDNIIDTVITAEKDTPTGGEMYIDAMENLGSGADGIRGEWLSGGELRDDLDSFNADIQNLLSSEDAARLTFTGKMAGWYGFTKVAFEELIGSPGEYTEVKVVFSK